MEKKEKEERKEGKEELSERVGKRGEGKKKEGGREVRRSKM